MKGLRYQKRIRLGKLLTLNISKTGIGLSLGVTGLRYTVGPTGSHFTIGLPGSGLRYQSKVSNNRSFRYSDLGKLKPGQGNQKATRASAQAALPEPEAEPALPKSPGWFAPGWEKALYKSLEAYLEADFDEAIEHLQEAVTDEETDPAAMIMLAFLLSEREVLEDKLEAIRLLETVVSADEEFPTPAMEAYLTGIEVNVAITPQVEVALPIEDVLAPVLLLVELYQATGEFNEAIGLLEEIDQIMAEGNNDAHDQIITLSLAELYLATKNYEPLLSQVQVPETIEDDVRLSTVFFYARALQESNLHEGAIQIYTRCLRRKKGFNPDLLEACRLWRALSYLKVDQRARARAELERVLAESRSEEIKRSTLQVLHSFWPEDFGHPPPSGRPALTADGG
jgi:tetratricopeptide (TPR) repeat protein